MPGNTPHSSRPFPPPGHDQFRSLPPSDEISFEASWRALFLYLSLYRPVAYLIRSHSSQAPTCHTGLRKMLRDTRQMGLRPGINPASCLRSNLDFEVGTGFLDAPPRSAPMVDAISGSGSGTAPGSGNPLLTLSLAQGARHHPRALDPPNLFSLWSLCLE